MCKYTGEVEFVILTLGAFPMSVFYGGIDRLAQDKMVQQCVGFGALLLIPEEMIHQWFELKILKIIHDTTVDPV